MGRGGPLEAPAVSSMQSQFSFGRAYTLAAADSSAASIENKRRNRAGALNEFLFRDADGVTPEPPSVPYMANPPFQIAPPDFRLGTAGSIYATSFQPPPPGFERASPSWYREQPQDSDRKHPSVGAPSNARAMKPPAPAIKARVGPRRTQASRTADAAQDSRDGARFQRVSDCRFCHEFCRYVSSFRESAEVTAAAARTIIRYSTRELLRKIL